MMGANPRTLPRLGLEGVQKLGDVMTAGAGRPNAESSEPSRGIAEHGHFLGRVKPLEFVDVHRDRQVVEILSSGKNERLPTGALLPFTVGSQAPNGLVLVAQLGGKRHPGGQGQAVPETARGKNDLGQRVRGGISGQSRVVTPKV